ncbi:MAG: hypothetical protein NVS4B3_19000 [Gemmatimonadaceae bacterium]
MHDVRALIRCAAVVPAAIAVVAAAATRGATQLPRHIAPGSVVTIPVRVDPRIHGDQGPPRFRVAPLGRARIFGPREGPVPTDSVDGAIIPLTFTIPGDEPAGDESVARLVVSWPGGHADTSEIRVAIDVVHRLEISLGADPPTVPERGSARLIYRIANRGNSVDTVRLVVDPGPDWRADWSREPMVIARGAEGLGIVEVAPSEASRAGEARTITLWANGAAGARQASLVVYVVRDLGPLPGLAQIPATVFVGAAHSPSDVSTPSAPFFAVDASGEIAAETELTLRYRHSPPMVPSAFHSHASGAGFQIGVRTPRWGATGGEVFTLGSALTGYYLQGLGARLTGTGDRVVTDLLVAEPEPLGDFGRRDREGHIARGMVGLRSAAGTVGVTLFDAARPIRLGLPLSQLQSAALRYDAPGVGEAHVETGVVRLQGPSAEWHTGPALDASYAAALGRTGVSARARATPGLVIGGDGSDRSMSGSAITAVSRHLSVETLLDHQSAPAGADSGAHRSSDATVGVRYFGDGRVYALRGIVSHFEGIGFGRAPGERRTLQASTTAPIGPTAVDASLESGLRIRGDTTRRISAYHAGLRWFGSGGWGWLRLSRASDDVGSGFSRADLAGSIRTPSYTVDLGGSLPLGSQVRASPALWWTGVTAQVTRATALVVGLEYRSRGPGAGWMTAIGARHRLALPLPLAAPTVSGVVFEDVNGNGRRDAGEPGIQGVRLSRDGVTTTSDTTGRFAFAMTSSAAQTTIDGNSLPAGMMTSQSGSEGKGVVRRTDVAVVRGATVTIHVLLDAHAAGAAASTVNPGLGAVATFVDAANRTRDAVADRDGMIVVDGLLPGSYHVTVRCSPELGRPASEVSRSLLLASGERRSEDVRLTVEALEVRGVGGSHLEAR